jgi:hypothetical protein
MCVLAPAFGAGPVPAFTVRVVTGHSIEAAVALGVKLENLHRVWRQVFLVYYAGEADVEALFNGRPLPSLPLQLNSGRLDVVYFRTKEEYHRDLKPSMPDIGISMGLYVPGNHTAYFYAGSEDTERTMYHDPDLLARTTGTEYAELDKQYRAYMKIVP